MSDAGVFFNPRTDYGFKLLFGQEESKEFLLHFLNALFEGEYVITDVTYRDKEIPGISEHDRDAIFDIYCTTDSGHHLVIEMQNARQRHFIDRCVWYVSRIVVNQNVKGPWDYRLDRVIGIFFMNFETDLTRGRLVSTAEYSLRQTGQQIVDLPRMYFINLCEAKRVVEENDTDTERWANIIKYMETMKSIPYVSLEDLKKEADSVWERLEEYARIHNFDQNKMRAYENSLNSYRDAIAIREAAIEDGMEIGIEKGIAQGIEKGAREKLRQVVVRLRKKGYDDSQIADFLDEDPEVISHL